MTENLLKFECPECGCITVQEIRRDFIQVSDITHIYEDGAFLIDKMKPKGGAISSYQCSKCAYYLLDENGHFIIQPLGLANWVKEYCIQD